MKKGIILFVFFFTIVAAKASKDSILAQGVFRNYIVHLPTGYTTSKSYPLVLNFHGLNSNSTQQEAYTAMNAVADSGQFVVVYPNAIKGSWNLSDTGDIRFVNYLIDSLKKDFSIDSPAVVGGAPTTHISSLP